MYLNRSEDTLSFRDETLAKDMFFDIVHVRPVSKFQFLYFYMYYNFLNNLLGKIILLQVSYGIH